MKNNIIFPFSRLFFRIFKVSSLQQQNRKFNIIVVNTFCHKTFVTPVPTTNKSIHGKEGAFVNHFSQPVYETEKRNPDSIFNIYCIINLRLSIPHIEPTVNPFNVRQAKLISGSKQ